MGRYAVLGMPHDGTWHCLLCGAVVADRQLHDTAVHGDWTGTNPDSHSLPADPPEKLPPRTYDRLVPNAQYAPPPQRDPQEDQ